MSDHSMIDVMQTLAVALIVLAAAGFVARRAWATLRPRKAGAGCDAGCGCGPEAGADRDWAQS
jgi:hypothetical protein